MRERPAVKAVWATDEAPAKATGLSMIFSENRFPLFGIML
jgi:hypothetical protein